MNNHRNILSTLSATALATLCRIQQLPGTERWYDCSYDATGTKLRTVHTIPSVPPAVPMEGGTDDESIVTTTDYSGGYIYENGNVDRLLTSNGFVTFATDGTPAYHYYLKDYLGNVRAVISHDGSVEQTAHYYPFGSLMATTEYQPEVTHPNRHLYGGKELDRTSGLDLLDFEARAYDPLLPRFRSMDPLCHKYYDISPYAYCANNPLRNIDPTGMIVQAKTEEEQKMILMSIPEQDREHVVFDENGYIDIEKMSKHNSDSGNYNQLFELVSSDIITTVSLDNSFQYADNDGSIHTRNMGSIEYDSDFETPNIQNPINAITGEVGFLGKTLLPGNGTSGTNSKDGNIHVVVNSELSNAGALQTFCHEAYGHGLMYVRTKDRNSSGHQFGEGNRELNKKLHNLIVRSIKEALINSK